MSAINYPEVLGTPSRSQNRRTVSPGAEPVQSHAQVPCRVSGCDLGAGPTGRCEELHNAQWPPASSHTPVRQGAAAPLALTDIGAFKAGRVDPPETMRQAQRWDSAFTRYARADLCARCASQAAWGGQIGYARVHAPCKTCAPIVADFPGAEHVNGWRSWPEMTVHHRPRGDSGAARALTAPGGPPTPVADTDSPIAA